MLVKKVQKTGNHILNANWFLTFLFVYVLINIYVNQIYLIGGATIRDFAEIGRISGIFLFFLCWKYIK